MYGGNCLESMENLAHYGKTVSCALQEHSGMQGKIVILHWQEQWHSEEHFVFIAVLNNLPHAYFNYKLPLCVTVCYMAVVRNL